MTTFLIVRHGEAEGNAEGRFIGQIDVPLTPLGRRQVERLAPTLLDLGITKIVSSDLQRAAETVRPVAELLGLMLEYEPRFREIANGEWAGLMADDIATMWPERFAAYRAGEDVAREGGERWEDVQRRVREALIELASASRSDDVVLVGTHAGPAMAIARWAAGHPPIGNVFTSEFPPVANTSVSTFQMISNNPRLIEYNRIHHL
ncbi:MAG: histidine phosphatase family protein [Acidimicrobiia bacterium]|nr:histidine phosphatase family protein [Acidimicrobiia bacterium]NNL28740.1 histidine phosphatase family protein [Acidimicrobiia bacterium]